MPTVEQAAQAVALWQKDIISFAKQALNITPTPQQEQILVSFQREGSFTSVKSGHGTGKTSSMAICALWHTSLFRPCKTIVTAPTYPQLRDSFIPELATILGNANPWYKDQLRLSADRLVMVGYEELQFMSARTARPGQESSLQGARADYTAYIIDECYGVTDKVFEVIKGAATKGGVEIGGRKSVYRLLMGGNPTRAVGFAYDTHTKLRDQWTTITLNSEKSPLVGKQFLDRMAPYKGTDEYRVRVLGEHPVVSQNTLISRDLVEAAAERKISITDYKYAPIIIGCDPAWMGGDRTAIVLRQGAFSTVTFCKQGADTFEVAEAIQTAWSRPGNYNPAWEGMNATACFIDQGMGNGIIDVLRRAGRQPVVVSFGSASGREDCYLKRTEMWVKMAEWLKDGGKIDKNYELINEMAGVEYKFNLMGKKVLEDKDSMRERTGRSPDIADALCLTFAFDIATPSAQETLARNNDNRPTAYNPFYEYDTSSKNEKAPIYL